MQNVNNKVIIRCLRGMLRPLMRFCLKRSLRIQDVIESAKVALLDVASRELNQKGQAVNVSRLAVMTGIHKRDVMRIYRDGSSVDESKGLVTHVIGTWKNHVDYTTKNKKPRVLSCDGENSEFYQLVRTVSNDLKPATVLFELERVGAVERTKRGMRLKAVGYDPRGDPEGGFSILADDTNDLFQAVEENIFDPKDTPNLHLRVAYDNIRPEQLSEIRDWLLNEGTNFQVRASKHLSKYDLDVTTHSNKESGGARVVLGMFSFTSSED